MTENTVNKPVFTALPFGAVKAKGYLLTQLQLQKEGLTGALENLSPTLQNNAWAGGTGDAWERAPYYVRGLVALAYVLDDAELKEKAQKWIDWTIGSQKSDGAFGPAGVDWWARMPMLEAIRDYGEATKDSRVIPFLKKYFQYQLKTLESNTLGADSWANNRAGDNIDIVMWYYDQTGEIWALDLAKLLYRQAASWEQIYLASDWTKTSLTGHIVNQHEGLKLLPLAYRAGCGNDLKNIYFKGIDSLNTASGRVDGMSNGDEHMRDISSVAGSETCSVVERMLSDEIALRIFGDAGTADHLEKVAFNSLPVTTTPDIKAQTYFNLQNQVDVSLGFHGFSSDGGDRLLYGVPGGYPCCIHNYSMGWPKYVGNMWAKTENDGIAAVTYGPSRVSTTVGGGNTSVTIEENTNYPFEDTIGFNMTLSKSAEFPFTLRIPEWCSDAKIKINDVLQNESYSSGTYVQLNRVWNNGDEVEIVLPMKIKLTNGENNSVSVERGPLVYALQIKENWVKLDKDYDEEKITAGDGSLKTRKEIAVRSDFPASDDPDFATYEIHAGSAWNYALVLNGDDPESSFTFSESNTAFPDQPFSSENVPVKLTVQAKQLPEWGLDNVAKVAEAVPQSPVVTEQPSVTVTLVPMGAARLRVALMPWTSDEMNGISFCPASRQSDRVLFKNVTTAESICVNYQNQGNSPAEADVYINGLKTEEISFSPTNGKETPYVFDTELLQAIEPKKYNQVEFVLNENDTENVTIHTIKMYTPCLSSISLEAEAADMLNCNPLDAESASGGSYVQGIDAVGAGLSWAKVPVDTTGEYEVKIFYATGFSNAYHHLIVNGAETYPVTYSTPTNWSSFSDSQFVKVKIILNAGNNSIDLIKPDENASFAQVDKIEILPIVSSGIVYEAENAVLTDCGSFDADTASGGKYVQNMDHTGAGVKWEDVSIEKSGYYLMKIFYATAMVPARHKITVNGTSEYEVEYTVGTNWSSFSDNQFVSTKIYLDAGKNTIAISKPDENAGFAQLDRILLERISDEITYEAESADTNARLTLSPNASGGQYIGGIDNAGSYLEWKDIEAPEAGKYQLKIFYATPNAASHTLFVNGTEIQTLSYTKTSGWGDFIADHYVTVLADLKEGANTVRIEKKASDTYFAEIDKMVVKKATEDVMMKRVIQIHLPDSMKVEKGTKFENLQLPESLTLVLSDGSEVSSQVEWKSACYDEALPFTQTLTGRLILPEQVENSYGLVPRIDVVNSSLLETLNTPSPTADVTALKITAITGGDDYELVRSALTGLSDQFAAYRVSLMKNEVEISPSGKINVTLDVPEGFNQTGLSVYFISDEGVGTKIPVISAGDGTVSFETQNTGIFAIAQQKTNHGGNTTDSPQTADRINLFLYLVLAMSGVLVVFINRRHKILIK